MAQQPETIDWQHVRYAGFWIRVAAALLDSVLLLIIIAIPLTLIYGVQYWGSTELVKGFWDIVINYVLPVVLVILLWVKYQATPGKMLIAMKIVDAKTGRRASTWQYIVRYFAYIPAMIPMCMGFIWIAFDPRKRGWHDYLSGTVVIYDDKQAAPTDRD